jgi:hypothetical protein
MQVNMHVRTMLENFRQTGTLGEGADRQTYDAREAAMGVLFKAGDAIDIASHDNTDADRDRVEGSIDLNPQQGVDLVPGGFGGVTSYRAEFKGSIDDPEEVTAVITGPQSKKIFYSSAMPGEPFIVFEALSKDDAGMIVASKFTKEGKEYSGYSESLEIPWHMAR